MLTKRSFCVILILIQNKKMRNDVPLPFGGLMMPYGSECYAYRRTDRIGMNDKNGRSDSEHGTNRQSARNTF